MERAKLDRFQILSKADQPIEDDAVLIVMLQDLLADRFKLALHRETRTMSALVLEVAKNGPKLGKADGGEAFTNTSSANGGATIDARNVDMESFAKILGRQTDLRVVNDTRLTGVFDLKLSWTRDRVKPRDTDATDEPSIFTAIREQLGLRLHSEKASIEVLVIDHVEEPSAN